MAQIGGYIVIDQTEALTTIDVNTGRYVGKTTHEDTVSKQFEGRTGDCRPAETSQHRAVSSSSISSTWRTRQSAARHGCFETALKQDKMRSNILKIWNSAWWK